MSGRCIVALTVRLGAAFLALALGAAAGSELEDCRSAFPAMMRLADETRDLGGDTLMLFDIVIVSRIDDPQARERGCRLFRQLLPKYEEIKRFADRCLVDDPEIDSSGFIRDLDKDIARATTFLATAGCP